MPQDASRENRRTPQERLAALREFVGILRRQLREAIVRAAKRRDERRLREVRERLSGKDI